MPNIPSVDLNNFLSDDQSLKQEFVNKLGKAYHCLLYTSDAADE